MGKGGRGGVVEIWDVKTTLAGSLPLVWIKKKDETKDCFRVGHLHDLIK